MVFSLEELRRSKRREDKKTSDVKTIVPVRIGGDTGGRQDPWPQEVLSTQSECSELTSLPKEVALAAPLPSPDTRRGIPCQIQQMHFSRTTTCKLIKPKTLLCEVAKHN